MSTTLGSVHQYHYAAEIAACTFLFATLGTHDWLFFSERVFWLKPKPVKGLVVIACVPVILFAVLTLNNVQNLVDAEGIDAIFLTRRGEGLITWGTYIRDLCVFVSAGTVVAAVVLPITLVVRLWQQIKTGLRTTSSKRSQDLS